MIIIVEGVDRVGKSTLCRMLSKSLGFKVFHDEYKAPYLLQQHNTSKPLVSLVDRYINQLIDVKFAMIKQWVDTVDNIIIDRCHLTEYAYDFNRGIYYSGLGEIDEWFSKRDTVMVLVASEDIHKSSEEHGSDLRTLEMIFKSLFYSSKVGDKRLVKYSDFDNLVDNLKAEVASRAIKAVASNE